MFIARHSFIQMSKLTNLKGRIQYISSHARQENLYAVYETTDRTLWKELANCNQIEFAKSGTVGKCIEARELIIALPESFVDYQPEMLLKLFTEHFKQNYGTECIAALHHNKRKTNYHIHLIFSERKLLDEPIEKIASRNMFYDENGKHVRTKKEILNEDGQLRDGCKVIPKGEVYERNIFTTKDSRFKSEKFLDEVKQSYTNLINIYVKDDKERLQVFDKNGVYLPMKKIGKNNPKEEQIKEDNEIRKQWNHTVDRALVSGVPEVQIMEVKQKEISQKVKDSIQLSGRQPEIFKNIVMMAIIALEILITMMFKKLIGQSESKGEKEYLLTAKAEMEEVDKEIPESKVTEEPAKKELAWDMPVKLNLASKYPRLSEVHQKLENQNVAICQKEQQLSQLEKDLGNSKGMFKGKQRKELQEQIEKIKSQIDHMKRYLSNIVQGYGYRNVKEFMADYTVAKLNTEHIKYRLQSGKNRVEVKQNQIVSRQDWNTINKILRNKKIIDRAIIKRIRIADRSMLWRSK